MSLRARLRSMSSLDLFYACSICFRTMPSLNRIAPEIHTPSEKPRRRSLMKVAYHCSQVASHAALASEGSLMAQSQRVAAQHTNRCMRTGTAPANV